MTDCFGQLASSANRLHHFWENLFFDQIFYNVFLDFRFYSKKLFSCGFSIVAQPNQGVQLKDRLFWQLASQANDLHYFWENLFLDQFLHVFNSVLFFFITFFAFSSCVVLNKLTFNYRCIFYRQSNDYATGEVYQNSKLNQSFQKRSQFPALGSVTIGL